MSLKEVRIKAGMSQSKLSAASSVNVRMIQHYEQGTKDIDGAKLHTLIDLSIALNCKISNLLNDADLKAKCKKTKL